MKQKTVAFLWDESFLWGLMAFKALKGLHLSFDLIKAEEIKAGSLENYRLLFVPGGWASNKSRALGEQGIEAIRRFVAKGGSYLGFCGGAGLATKAKGGIGLLPVKRRPTKDRVPSFSGQIHLNISHHAIWHDLSCEAIFNAWWPSQFVIEDESVKTLATYGHALPGSFSSDLNVGDVESIGSWDDLENVYKINLDPERLKDEPAVIEGVYGKGKVILSLAHFDTPDDIRGQSVLVNLWKYLAEENAEERSENRELKEGTKKSDNAGRELYELCSELISLGERNFLWFWRNSMLLQWRRGVRGLEYNSMYIMTKEISEILDNRSASWRKEKGDRYVVNLKGLLIPFIEKAKTLLLRERFALQKSPMSYERCDDPAIQELRKELFSESKSHGGTFKALIDEIDGLLFLLLTENQEGY